MSIPNIDFGNFDYGFLYRGQDYIKSQTNLNFIYTDDTSALTPFNKAVFDQAIARNGVRDLLPEMGVRHLLFRNDVIGQFQPKAEHYFLERSGYREVLNNSTYSLYENKESSPIIDTSLKIRKASHWFIYYLDPIADNANLSVKLNFNPYFGWRLFSVEREQPHLLRLMVFELLNELKFTNQRDNRSNEILASPLFPNQHVFLNLKEDKERRFVLIYFPQIAFVSLFVLAFIVVALVAAISLLLDYKKIGRVGVD